MDVRRHDDASQTGAPHYDNMELLSMQRAHRYYAWIFSLMKPYIGKKVMDLGAGIGTFAELILSTRPTSLVLVEPATNLFDELAAKFSHLPNLQLFNGDIHQYEKTSGDTKLDTIPSVNVLEHIEDDVSVLRSAFRLLSPGGRIVLFVPAVPAIFGTLDVTLGHYRRYSRKEVWSKLEAAGAANRSPSPTTALPSPAYLDSAAASSSSPDGALPAFCRPPSVIIDQDPIGNNTASVAATPTEATMRAARLRVPGALARPSECDLGAPLRHPKSCPA